MTSHKLIKLKNFMKKFSLPQGTKKKKKQLKKKDKVSDIVYKMFSGSTWQINKSLAL